MIYMQTAILKCLFIIGLILFFSISISFGSNAQQYYRLACDWARAHNKQDIVLAACSDLAKMTSTEIDAANPYVLCPRLHYEAAPAVIAELKRIGLVDPDDFANMRQRLVVPGMTTCDMFITLGESSHQSTSRYIGLPDETQWQFGSFENDNMILVYTSNGHVTAVQEE